ncbi:MAG: SDR family oxidoreductase [Phycisphaeraceae bacterium]|nr:SDR family oxidoreductase [Phycisphaeraceae bacterium]
MDESELPVAIITGAGSGVGRDLAVLMAEAGYRCVLAARTEADLEETAALIATDVPDAESLVVPTDVADPDAVNKLVSETLRRFGRIDALANIAGYAPLQPIDRIEDETLRRVTAVNFDAVVYATRAAWPTFKAQKAGVVCNVSSMGAFDPFTGFNIYGAAKAAVNIFTKATADEGKRLNVNAYAIAPGAIETPMLRENFSEKVIPAENTLDPMDVAAAIRDCLTGKTDMQSGETRQMPSH